MNLGYLMYDAAALVANGYENIVHFLMLRGFFPAAVASIIVLVAALAANIAKIEKGELAPYGLVFLALWAMVTDGIFGGRLWSSSMWAWLGLDVGDAFFILMIVAVAVSIMRRLGYAIKLPKLKAPARAKAVAAKAATYVINRFRRPADKAPDNGASRLMAKSSANIVTASAVNNSRPGNSSGDGSTAIRH